MAADYGRALGFSFVSSGTTQVRTINANASAGEKAVVFASCLEDLTLSVSDSTGGSNVYNVTKIRSTSASPITLFLVYCDLVNPYVSGSTTISLAYSGTQSWGLQEGHVLTGCNAGLVEAQTDTNKTTPWSTPSSTTTDGSILFGAALYRNAVDCTFSVDSVSPAITALDDLKFGSSNLGSCYRKIATGGTHNISGTWSDGTGAGGCTAHMYFSVATAPIPGKNLVTSPLFVYSAQQVSYGSRWSAGSGVADVLLPTAPGVGDGNFPFWRLKGR